MRPDGLNRTRRRSLLSFVAGDRRRAAITSVVLAALFLLALFAGRNSRFFGGTPTAVNAGAGRKSPGDEHRVGSILIMLWSGDMCEQRRFDNASGQMLSMGLVNCDEALAHDNASVRDAAHDNTARMRAILKAFKK